MKVDAELIGKAIFVMSETFNASAVQLYTNFDE